jgi:hypothetical protein
MINHLKVNICDMYNNSDALELCIVPTEYILVFHMSLTIKGDYFPKQN